MEAISSSESLAYIQTAQSYNPEHYTIQLREILEIKCVNKTKLYLQLFFVIIQDVTNYCCGQEYVDLYIHSPIYLNGLMINQLGKGKFYFYLLDEDTELHPYIHYWRKCIKVKLSL